VSCRQTLARRLTYRSPSSLCAVRSGQTAGGSLDTGELSLDSTPVPAGLPFNVAQLYMRMAEGIREGRSVARLRCGRQRDQLLEVIQKGSDGPSFANAFSHPHVQLRNVKGSPAGTAGGIQR